jgi:hypothetical protein
MGVRVTIKGFFFGAFKLLMVPLTLLVMTLVSLCALVFHTALAVALVLYHVVGFDGFAALTLLIALLWAAS